MQVLSAAIGAVPDSTEGIQVVGPTPPGGAGQELRAMRAPGPVGDRYGPWQLPSLEE